MAYLWGTNGVAAFWYVLRSLFGSGRTGPCSISGHSTFFCPSRPTLRDIWAGFGFWASNLRASNLRALRVFFCQLGVLGL